MPSIDRITIPLAHVGSVNAWLLRGDPVTLVDTGHRSDESLAALEHGLRSHGLRVEDIELVIGTHHHHDHVGLAAAIRRRAGARIALLAAAADYCSRYDERVELDRRFSRELMTAAGVPPRLHELGDDLWRYIGSTAERFEADVRLEHGDRIRAGGRDLSVVARPGHSGTDTLFVDERARLAFAGDHLLAKISSNTEIYRLADAGLSRSPSRLQYVDGLKQTARMPLVRLLTGHGPAVTAHSELVRRRLAQDRRRCRRIIRALEDGPATAYAVAEQLWSAATVGAQPLLVVWEVLGHLDLMRAAGIVRESAGDAGNWHYSLARA
jgi:glyoxylase-like metal-dependent hydrolase (beta-lactamase superfamily II)